MRGIAEVRNLKLQKIEVGSILANKRSIEFFISFNGRKEKTSAEFSELENPQAFAMELLKYILDREGSMDSADKDIIKVVLQDREKVTKTLINYFSELNSHLAKLKDASVAEGYLEAIRKVRGSKIVF